MMAWISRKHGKVLKRYPNVSERESSILRTILSRIVLRPFRAIETI
jgi:hypothetical protein